MLESSLAFAVTLAEETMIVFWVVGITLCLFILVILGTFIRFFNLWFQALLSGAPVGFLDLIGMRFRKVDPGVIVGSLIMAKKAGLEVTAPDLETLYLSRGNVSSVMDGLIAADAAGMALTWEEACAVDLAYGLSRQAVEHVAGAAQAGFFLSWLSAAKMARDDMTLRDVLDSGGDPVADQPLERL